MDGIFRPWADLPQEIVEIIISKLRFLNQNPAQWFRDLIRALAVCKSWCDCKDSVSNLDILPCAVIVNHEIVRRRGGPIKHYMLRVGSEKESGDYKYTTTCKLFDPQNVSQIFNSIETPEIPSIFSWGLASKNENGWLLQRIFSWGLASKNGWLLQLVIDYTRKSSILTLYHPFANHIIFLLPKFVNRHYVKAAMKGGPSSPECEIFVISNSDDDEDVLIHTFCQSKDYVSQSEIVEKGKPKIVPMTKHDFYSFGLQSVLYMKGKIYFLFNTGVLYCYGLNDISWKVIATALSGPYTLMFNGWLLEINENIIMVCTFNECKTFKWMIFRLDWSKMSWVVETSLKSCAIYISQGVAFSTSLANRYGKKLQGCMVFYHNRVFVADSDMELKDAQLDAYGWIRHPASFFCFVDPPHLVTSFGHGALRAGAQNANTFDI